ncbi:hypothetical protein [Acidovorax sp. PRC11]|uniref:hypothetical protein n=1 Tax=Acidovorax sp. PRC11 TaxID=2962592 RepID=UPI00288114ED|nr:hypothetical protein [Acidovorax sp. PRC11]MDT0136630.1 hypothetical protein [Acidovorax sp. PRC11]
MLTSLEDYTALLGDDVLRKELELCLAFKRLKNFATVVLAKKGGCCICTWTKDL